MTSTTACPHCQAPCGSECAQPGVHTCHNCGKLFKTAADGRVLAIGSGDGLSGARDASRVREIISRSSAVYTPPLAAKGQMAEAAPAPSAQASPPTAASSGLPASPANGVTCPHCGHRYPFSPVLLNRPVRCRQCAGVFRVGPDRRASALSTTVNPAYSRRSPTTRGRQTTLGRSDSGRLQAKKDMDRVKDRLSKVAMEALDRLDGETDDSALSTKRIDRASRTIAASGTNHPARDASRRHTAKVSEPPRRQSTRKGPGTSALVRRKSSVVGQPQLSGTGSKTGQSRRRHRIVLATILALTVVFIWWVTSIDPKRQALNHFQSHGFTGLSPGQRIVEMQSRSPLGAGSVMPIVNLSSARFGGVKRLQLTALNSILAGKGLVERGVLWADRDHLVEAKLLWSQHGDPSPGGIQRFIEQLKAKGIEAIPHVVVITKLRQQLRGPDGDLLLAMLQAPVPNEGVMDLTAMLADGPQPTALELVAFQGTDGRLLIPQGRPIEPIRYQGRLVRMLAEHEQGAWQLLELQGG